MTFPRTFTMQWNDFWISFSTQVQWFTKFSRYAVGWLYKYHSACRVRILWGSFSVQGHVLWRSFSILLLSKGECVSRGLREGCVKVDYGERVYGFRGVSLSLFGGSGFILDWLSEMCVLGIEGACLLLRKGRVFSVDWLRGGWYCGLRRRSWLIKGSVLSLIMGSGWLLFLREVGLSLI